MEFKLRKAQRKQTKMKLGIQGPSGSGKTYSALLLAYGLIEDWSRIAVIDTENHSSELYSHFGEYNVLSLKEPFSPERYIEAIETCEKAGMEVIILDSISHEWEGKGGILEVHSRMTGNSFTNWHKVTPWHNAFVQKILQSPTHIIGTIRSKQDFVLSEKNGKMVPEKVGLKGVQRDGVDYELTIVFELDIKHNCTASKDRTSMFVDRPQFVISEKTGRKIRKWCNQGTDLDSIRQEIEKAQSRQELGAIYNNYPEMKEKIYPMILKRKEVIDNSNVTNQQNG
ncbi:MAG: AAA family ATPase [Bacteroidales bacterium]